MQLNELRNNLPLLYDFYIVAKEKTITRASEKNYVSLSNLSRNIKNLEKELKCDLVVTNNKGVKLTKNGESLFNQLDTTFYSLLEEFIEDENKVQGTLTIGTTRNISDNKLSDYVAEFSSLYPDVKINFFIDSATNLNEFLVNHKIDVLIDYLPHINFSEKYNLEIKSFSRFKTCFACSKSFYEKYGKDINSLNDLNKFKLIIPGKSRRRQYLDEILQLNNIKLNPIIQMPDSKLMIDLVSNGDFIGYFIEDEIKNTNLVKLELNEEMPTNPIGLIYFKNTINKSTKKFIELIFKNID